jgi:hypothetical protein
MILIAGTTFTQARTIKILMKEKILKRKEYKNGHRNKK